MIHELSHGVHLLGAKYAISGWQNRLTYQYNAARRSGRWANTYAMSTADEYFVSSVWVVTFACLFGFCCCCCLFCFCTVIDDDDDDDVHCG